MSEHNLLCSPVDKIASFYPAHNREELTSNLPPINSIDIEEFYVHLGREWQLIPDEVNRNDKQKGKKAGKRGRGGRNESTVTGPQATQGGGSGGSTQREPQAENAPLPENAKETSSKQEKEFGSVSEFIEIVDQILNSLPQKNIKFRARGDNYLGDHPTGTLARPDIIAYTESLTTPGQNIPWSSVEIAIEYHSKGRSREKRIKQAASYAAYLLEARPDLKSTLGLLVDYSDLVFIICSPSGVWKLELTDPVQYRPLLRAVIEYLNDGSDTAREKSLERKKSNDPKVGAYFNVDIPHNVNDLDHGTICCHQWFSSDPFGRWTTILKNVEEPPVEVKAVRVIKEQYIRRGRRCTEKDILSSIHVRGSYPAIARMVFAYEVLDAVSGGRVKYRIGLADCGKSFLDLKTPREVLHVVYDLLEVTRGLYCDRNILHRDISPGNILFHQRVWNPPDSEVAQDTSVHFIEHVLGSHPNRYASSLLLIDFGYSQDLSSDKKVIGGRTGTPVFIARAVMKGKPLRSGPTLTFPPLPRLEGAIAEKYAAIHRKRWQVFDGPYMKEKVDLDELDVALISSAMQANKWRHELRHDAESVMWCLIFWAIIAAPKDYAGPEHPIRANVWGDLQPHYGGNDKTRPIDDRQGFLAKLIEEDSSVGMVHPEYRGLLPLLTRMANELMYDHHWSSDSNRKKPDYVHEALQRMILDFLQNNDEAKFMDKEKRTENRKIQLDSLLDMKTPSETELTRTNSMKSSYSSGYSGRKRKAPAASVKSTPLRSSTSSVNSDYEDEDEGSSSRLPTSSRESTSASARPEDGSSRHNLDRDSGEEIQGKDDDVPPVKKPRVY